MEDCVTFIIHSQGHSHTVTCIRMIPSTGMVTPLACEPHGFQTVDGTSTAYVHFIYNQYNVIFQFTEKIFE